MASSSVDPSKEGYVFKSKSAKFFVYIHPKLGLNCLVKDNRFLIESTSENVTLFHGILQNQQELESLNVIFARGLNI